MNSEIIEAIVLGLVQGLTEFIPVSSSGHLILFGELFGFSQSSFGFELALNVGTLLALIIYFSKDLWQIARQITNLSLASLPVLLIISTVPAILIGGLGLQLISTVFRSPLVVVLALIVVGIVMIISDKLIGKRTVKDVTVKDAILIGFAQALAFIPGVSRSGITIVTGRYLGFSHNQAARFSFLMAIPIMIAALARLLFEPEIQSLGDSLGTVAVGILVSFIAGLGAIHFMLRFLQKNGLSGFGYYRIVIGTVVLFTLLNRGVI